MKFDKSSHKFFKNWQIKILCFVFALFIYAFVAFESDGERVVTMPLEIIMPDGYKPASLIPESASVIIRGSEKQIYLVDVNRVRLYADFSEVHDKGVASANITVDYSELMDYINFTDISIFTKPSVIKIYFE